ncbi:MAG: hypothetical protein QM740_17860 [Acidovorax sp.]
MSNKEPSIIDTSAYMDDLEAFDISEEEKIAFLEALCFIMKTFVDIGWGVDSVQRIFPALFEREEATSGPLQAAGSFNAEAAIENQDQEKGAT